MEIQSMPSIDPKQGSFATGARIELVMERMLHGFGS
jgi:hypothetical protein